ncbi:MAG: alanyl-tRNA editing protein [Alphaproteobacteria bacterium]|nr:alanyl-tRNA editing protein [Alphaproteobacteria bacterium]
MPTELVFRAEPYAKSCAATVAAVEPRGVVLDRTVFYPTGGGQPGDQGLLRLADGTTLRVVDAVKGDGPDSVVHVLEPGASVPAPGTPVTAELDWDRRHRHMRMHTCLHLLSAVLPYPVTGGQVAADKGRLDFDIPEATLGKDAITAKVNELIAADHAVATRWITDDELAAQPELVKTMAVKPPTGHGRVRLIEVAGLDLQPCGGTHVARTGEIGRVEVTKIEKKGRINRRVVIGFADNKA